MIPSLRDNRSPEAVFAASGTLATDPRDRLPPG